VPQYKKTLVWFRRDLRSVDHAALHQALTISDQVYCAFIYDRAILDSLPRYDRRVEFIHDSIDELSKDLQNMGGALLVRPAVAETEIVLMAKQLAVDAVLANRDYEPRAVARDAAVSTALEQAGCKFHLLKDQVIFEQGEVLSQKSAPLSIFTPYKNAWLKKLAESPVSDDDDYYLRPYPIETHQKNFAKPPSDYAHDCVLPSLEKMGFEKTNLSKVGIPAGMSGAKQLLDQFRARLSDYNQTRNYPGVSGTSYMSVHLRFGTVSIRTLARLAVEATRSGEHAGAATWLSELIWRDFYFMILHFHPHVAEHAFKREYEQVQWESGADADALFEAWCAGRTGYPLVDAAMAQINQTGFMHNRLRMVTACFLIKDLGIDWRRGERYFAEKLNDFDLSANNGGWQWAASSGCDAQPYFRIFNPITQSEKFDGDGIFIRRYLPQLAKLNAKQIHAPWLQPENVLRDAGLRLGHDYPKPVVQHEEARKRTLERYAVVKKKTSV
jgi:deoxyribodipyrimidine photo-lyase